MTTKATKDYSQGKIYKIEPTVEHDEGDIYIGSTTKKYLSQRMTAHRKDYTRWKDGKKRFASSFNLFDKYGIENCNILLLENVNTSNYDELVSREEFYVKTLTCVNINIPFKTEEEHKQVISKRGKEYTEKNKEKINEQRRLYRAENTEKIKEQKRLSNLRNKEKIKGHKSKYREVNKDVIKKRKKKYYEENNEAILEKQKSYCEANREHRSEYNKMFREQHREEINQKKKEYYEVNKEEILKRQKEQHQKKKQEK